MKKIKLLFISLILIFGISINVFAASGSLSVSSESVYVGDSFTVTVNVNSAAAWNIHVSSSGPVSGCSINQADATADAMDTNKTFSATCTSTNTGTITVTLSGDVTSASDGNAFNVSGSKSITVLTKPSPPNNNNNNNNNSNNYQTDNRSKNNNIKEISVEGFELTKIDNNNYTLSVSNDITSINIKAVAEDSKAKITGIGVHDIKIGENNIEVIVTAENGLQNKINIKVNRKEDYYLEDLDNLLNNKIDNINITIMSDTKINLKDLEKISKNKKLVNFNYYNENKLLMYCWTIDGSKAIAKSELLTTISNDSSNKKDILRLSNYADGLFFELKQKEDLPKGAKLKIFVGNKYEENDLVNVYSYVKNNNKLELVQNKIKVEDGYIKFDIIDSSDYFVTLSNILIAEDVTTPTEKESISIVPIIISMIAVSIICEIILFKIMNKKNKKKVLPM